MGQDLRKLFKEEQQLSAHKMKDGHEERFLQKLEEELPVSRKRSNFYFMKIAASIAVLLAAGVISYNLINSKDDLKGGEEVVETNTTNTTPVNQITLGNISPDLKKVEDYYVTNINLQLSSIEVNEENKQLFDGYMKKLTELDDDYKLLNKELNEVGPNEQTITALINNLQIRLQLLNRLQKKLQELKEDQNETFKNETV
ncbi:hypothetical protein GWK08_02005 [Leptobacterium flavescens]|uniref:Anti-sigma factor n=1 Tax=Leptobacterium flavescens TaxID=472055 RepID=A0A6P0UG25_9FLAO|nr:hypothetical protein [Leptobacterium flavescens]NER12204.1 hypothetical protein [Leptobacterium flavescens]